MDFLVYVGLVLLLAWSAYSFMHSRKKFREKGLLFYSELLPELQEYEFSKSSTQFPILSGIYQGYKIKMVPEADKSVFQRLPRLYLRIYIYVPGTVLLRLRKLDIDTQSNHLFLPSSFEKSHQEIRINYQNYRLFLGKADYPANLTTVLEDLFPVSNNVAEMLFQQNFIRVTILLAKGNRSAYIMTRAADFSELIFKREFFQSHIQAILEIHKQLNQPDLEDIPQS